MDIDQFTKNYVYEQARLAALFPKISSEIRTYDSSEIDGNQYNDLHFLFTFDDGPSGPLGSTDQLLAVMQQKKIPGLFFVLGERLNQRLQVTQSHDAAKLYTGMILGSHGYTHVSHAKQKNWVESIYKCDSLINVVSGKKEIIPFRPPYGQRIPTAYSDLSAKSSIVLWNIDTQDWNATLSKEQIYGRTLALMTLWRRGIILFHDIHDKAKYVVPAVVDATQGSGIIWTGSY
jgi:peptidoglycan/xylan/chitin deacetylase (PgdA/CDA1 family)